MTNKSFLFNEYKKAVRKGYYYYAWVILQNLQVRARLKKNLDRLSDIHVTETGLLVKL